MLKVRPAGKMSDKPMSVAVLKSVLREKITGSPDKSVRQYFKKKLAALAASPAPRREKDHDPLLN